jgi:hypothetical protein
MAQRIFEPGEIEILAQRSIPRVRLPARATVFARRGSTGANLARASAWAISCASLRCCLKRAASKRSAGAARNGSFDYLGWPRISALLPAAGARFGRRTVRTFPLLPPPQKN